jgi:glycosyltransferase involved in cell wall biosynthesis
LLALAQFVRDQPAHGPLDVILLLRYQPDFYDNPLCARAFRTLERAAAAGRRVRLASDSARLSRELGRLTHLAIEVMPIPHTSAEAAPPARPPGAPLRFVSLGNARDEKGYVEILDAIRLLRASGELDGLEFVLQSNDATPDVQAAIDAFSLECPANVTLLRESLSPEQYTAQLMAADAVLVPYWREIYRDRTSGVFLESLAAGKVVVATSDTWMSDELERYGAGVLVDDHDPGAIAAAIRTVRRDRVRLAERAAAGRAACLARHSPAALVRQAMNGAPTDAMPGRGVRRVALLYPWGDFLDRRSGASQRCNLLVEKLAPLVEEIRVLQDGPWLGLPPPERIIGWLLALPFILLARLFAEPHRATAGGPPAVRRGNVQVEQATLRARQHLARRLFRLPFRLLPRRHFGQELMLWFFLERRMDPAFAARVQEMVAWADVVLLEYPFWASIVAPACRARGKKLILTNYDVLAQQVTGWRWLHRLTARLENSGMASADHAVCASAADQAWFAGAGITTQVIPNPVDRDRLTAPVPGDLRLILRELYDTTLPPGPVCLFIGSRFGPNIEAAARIKDVAVRLPPAAGPVAFVIAGTCAEPARGPNWVALGRVEDGVLALLYQLTALVVIPLQGGTGSSVKTVEALGAGKPVFGTSTAFRGLSLRPGVDCVLQDDLARWPAQIAELLAAPTRLAAIAAAARQAGEAYDYRRVFDAYLPLIGLPPASPTAAPNSIRYAVLRDVLARALEREKLEVVAMLLTNPDLPRDAVDLAMVRQLLAAALQANRLPVALIAADRLEALGSPLESAVLRDLVLRATDAGAYDLAASFLQRLDDRQMTTTRGRLLRQLGRAMELGEFDQARALLGRLERDAAPMRAVGS